MTKSTNIAKTQGCPLRAFAIVSIVLFKRQSNV